MLASLLAIAAAALGPGGAGTASQLTLDQAVGQRIVVSLPGTTVPDALARQVRRGEVAGVILFSRNVASRTQLRALTGALQAERDARAGRAARAPAAGDDRPGGRAGEAPAWRAVAFGRGDGRDGRRRSGPRRRASRPRATCAASASTSTSRRCSTSACRARSSVRRGARSRPTPASVTRYGGAFADGLAAGGVLAAAKHFPGLGRGSADEDRRLNRIDVPLATLRRTDEAPFRDAARGGVPLTMVSTGIYPALSTRPAMFSRAVTTDELRGRRRLRRRLDQRRPGGAGARAPVARAQGARGRARRRRPAAVLPERVGRGAGRRGAAAGGRRWRDPARADRRGRGARARVARPSALRCAASRCRGGSGGAQTAFSALLLDSDAEDEEPFRRQEALQADRQGQGPRPSRVHEPHPREEVAEGEAPPRQAGRRSRDHDAPRIKKLLGAGK